MVARPVDALPPKGFHGNDEQRCVPCVALSRSSLGGACLAATADDVSAKGAKTKPRYSAKEQWWWEFSDPSIHGLMENMDRAMLGLKQQHDLTWRSLEPTKKRTTKKKATGIDVRDNRYIPQWVKIHVVLRDKVDACTAGKATSRFLSLTTARPGLREALQRIRSTFASAASHATARSPTKTGGGCDGQASG